MVHYDIVVTGRIYKVGYRFYALQRATQLGLKGFVQYQTSSSIRIEIEGEDEKVQSFLQWCKRGTSGAKVDDIQITQNDMKNYQTFQISHSEKPIHEPFFKRVMSFFF